MDNQTSAPAAKDGDSSTAAAQSERSPVNSEVDETIHFTTVRNTLRDGVAAARSSAAAKNGSSLDSGPLPSLPRQQEADARPRLAPRPAAGPPIPRHPQARGANREERTRGGRPGPEDGGGRRGPRDEQPAAESQQPRGPRRLQSGHLDLVGHEEGTDLDLYEGQDAITDWMPLQRWIDFIVGF
ncbi:thiamine metabolism- protein [Hypoxylon texense]